MGARKSSMLSLDIYAWVKENSDKIEGGFIKKIYQTGEREFIIKIYKEKTRSLYINLNGFVYFAERETPNTPSMFVMYLRKWFSNRKIVKFRQINFDRIIEFDTGELSLIFELFGGGNIIILENNIIEKAYVEREWRYRTIRKGYEYKLPQPKKHPLEDIDSICEVINSSSKDVVRSIATEYNLGKYAEEACYRANVEKNKRNVSEEECSRLKEAIRSLFDFDGCYLYPDFFAPIRLEYRDADPKRYDTLDECMEQYLNSYKSEASKHSKLEAIKEMQLKKIEEFKELAEKNKKIGDTIYAHFQEVGELLRSARAGALKKDKKDKIKANFDDLEFELYINKSPGDNATIYYDKSKKAREKIKGAMKAIEEIDNKLKKEQKTKSKEKKKSRRRFWFEKYRWFISTEEMIVIGGKNIKTNEEIVKKHLGSKDLYMHADIHGAPSVVIKSDGKEIGERTLREAAQFAVSMSKAWNAGLGNLSAYWVYPSQVSKMGESGEYVARGSWVIHGKRNYIHNVPLELGVGTITYQNTELVMCGPVEAVKSKSENYVLIVPGDTKKEEIAKQLARKFNTTVDDLLAILPPGKIKIVK